MPAPIALKARLDLTGPHNIKPVVASLQRQLNGVTANVNVKIDKRAIANVDALAKRFDALNKNLTQTQGLVSGVNSSLQQLTASFNNLSNIKQVTNNLNQTQNSLKKVSTGAKKAQTEMQKFGEQAALAVRRFTAFTVATGAIFGFVRAITTATSEAIEFDKQLTKISQVTKLGKSNLKPLVDEITRLSVGLGVSSTELLDVAQVLAQAGLSATDTRKALEALAKTSLAPTFSDITNTTEAAIAAMAQFNIEASDLESVLGSINSVAAAFAVEAEDLTTVIRRTGGVFAAAGSQLDDPKEQLNELLALFTSVRATTRESAETIATGFRTIFSRIQRRSTIEFLRNFNIDLLDTEQRFVGVFEAVKRLNEGLSGFQQGDIALAGIIEELGGFRQVSKVIPLIQQFAKAQTAFAIAQKGQTSLTEDAAIAQESLANKILKVKEEFLALIRAVSQSETFKVLTTSILGVASALIRVAETLQPILPLLTAIAGVKLVSGVTQFVSGFFGGIRGGGGVGAVGSNLGAAATGSSAASSASASASLIASLSANTAALKLLTSAIQTMIPKITLARARGFARGGIVPGVGNTDSVPANLMPGEFVLRKSAVRAIGAERLYAANRRNTGSKGAERFGPPMSKAEQAAAKARALGPATAKAELENIILGDLQNPAVGGLFLRPAPGEDKNSVRNKLFGGLTPDAQNEIQKRLGRTVDPKSKVFGAFEFNFIESESAKAIEQTMESNIVGAVADLTKKFGSGLKLPSDQMINTILQTSGLENITGSMFETFINAISGNIKPATGARFDIDAGGNADIAALNRLFGPFQAPYQDVKRTLTDDAVRGSKSTSLFNKMLSILPRLNISSSNQTPGFAKFGTAGAKLTGFARGGLASSDTIPAMLTPGEFVMRKEAVDKIGVRTLRAMNNMQVKGFAEGDLVGTGRFGRRLVKKSRSVFAEDIINQNTPEAPFTGKPPNIEGRRDLFSQFVAQATAQQGNAGADKVKAADAALKKFSLSNAEYAAAIKRMVTLLEQGASVEKAKNRTIAAVNLLRERELSQSVSGTVDKSKDARLRAIAAGVPESALIPPGQKGSSVGVGRGLLNRFNQASSFLTQKRIFGKQLTEEQQAIRSNRRALIGSSLATAGFLAAGQFQDKGAIGAGLSTGVSGALTLGGIGSQFGATAGAAGVLVGVVAGFDAFVGELERINDELRSKEIEKSISQLQEALKTGATSISAAAANVLEKINSNDNLSADALGSRRFNQLGISGSLSVGAKTVANSVTGIFGKEFFDADSSTKAIRRTESVANIEAAKEAADAIIKNVRKRISAGESADTVIDSLDANSKKILLRASDTVNADGFTSGSGSLKAVQSLFETFRDEGSIVAAAKAGQEAILKLDRLGDTFSILNAQVDRSRNTLEQFTLAQENIAASFGGRIGRFSNPTENVLGNLRGSTTAEINQAVASAQKAGLDQTAARILKEGALAQKILPGALTSIKGDTPEAQVDSIIGKLFEAGLGFDSPVFNAIKAQLDRIASDPRTEGGDNFKEQIEQLDIDALLGNSFKEAQTLAVNTTKLLGDSANTYAQSLERLTDLQNQYSSELGSVIDLRANREIELQRSRGIDPSLRTLTSGFRGRLGATGFLGAGPGAIGTRLQDLIARQQGTRSAAQAALASGNQGEAARLLNETADLTDQINKAKTALELFAKDTTVAAAIQERLNATEKKRGFANDFIGQAFGNRLGLGKQIGALERFQAGDDRVFLTAFEDLKAGIELQKRFFESQGKGDLAKEIENAFLKRGEAALGLPEGFLTSFISEEEGLRKLEVEAAKAQILAATEMLKVTEALLGETRKAVGRATGGPIRGAGTGTSDSISARLSNGEYVLRASAVSRLGVNTLDYMNSTGEIPGFAGGGIFERASARRSARRARLAARGIRTGAGGTRQATFTDVLGRTASFFDRRELTDGHRKLFAGTPGLDNARTLGDVFRANIFGGVGVTPTTSRFFNRFANVRNARRLKRRAGFAEGGFVGGGGSGGGSIGLDPASLGSLNAFVLAANNLAGSLNALQNIPTQITMTGNHTVNVVVNGAEVLNNLLQGPLAGLIQSEIERSLSRYDKELRG